MTTPLAGLAVLVTRPREHAGELSTRLAGLGAEPLVAPTIEIVATVPDAASRQALQAAATADWLVFVSRPAVRHGLARLRELGVRPPPGLITVGPGTAAELASAGLQVRLQPQVGFNSEALLAMPELQRLDSASVVIVRGVGGRELLGESLSARGATLRYAEVYRRQPPSEPQPAQLLRWSERPRRLALVTSLEGLTNLLAMAGRPGRAALLSADLVTVSQRVAEAARAEGFQGRVVVAPRPDDDGLLAAIECLNKQD